MHRLPPRTCEAKIGEAWRVISLREAKSTYATALQRCPACHGRVFVTGSYTREGAFRLQHQRSHPGCAITRKDYRGISSPHPQAIT